MMRKPLALPFSTDTQKTPCVPNTILTQSGWGSSVPDTTPENSEVMNSPTIGTPSAVPERTEPLQSLPAQPETEPSTEVPGQVPSLESAASEKERSLPPLAFSLLVMVALLLQYQAPSPPGQLASKIPSPWFVPGSL